MMRGPGSGVLLGRALCASAAHAGFVVTVEERESTAWHSATFSGQRHALEVTAPANGTWRLWLETIGAINVALPGHLLADLCVTREGERGGQCHARIEALTVAEA
jgi:hypothetical protein